jgi:hypothetical protein
MQRVTPKYFFLIGIFENNDFATSPFRQPEAALQNCQPHAKVTHRPKPTLASQRASPRLTPSVLEGREKVVDAGNASKAGTLKERSLREQGLQEQESVVCCVRQV